MTHQLVVPKNKMGIFEYHNTFKEDNSLLINLSSDEYTQLCESGALDLMNEQCGILMDEYEEDPQAEALDFSLQHDNRHSGTGYHH